jgi:hypothetical protein
MFAAGIGVPILYFFLIWRFAYTPADKLLIKRKSAEQPT